MIVATAHRAGVVTEIRVKVGDQVSADDTLVTIEPAEEDE